MGDRSNAKGQGARTSGERRRIRKPFKAACSALSAVKHRPFNASFFFSPSELLHHLVQQETDIFNISERH